LLKLCTMPIERIQLLCGHKSRATTEKYIKARWQETAAPNILDIGQRPKNVQYSGTNEKSPLSFK